MATSRPFAYNVGSQISGTTQIGDLAVGYPVSGFTNNPQFWNGPDEDLGYVICEPNSGGNQPNPVGIPAYVRFLRSKLKTEQSFVNLVNGEFNQSFTSGNECKSYLDSNGYWNSWVDVTPTPTPTPTLTPTPTNTVTPTITPTNTNTPTPTPSSTPSPVLTNLVLYYDPSNVLSYSGSGTTLKDISGNGLNATLSATTFTTPYFTYNGTNSTTYTADNSLLEPGTGDFTVEIWVNQSVIAGSSRVLIAKTDTGLASGFGYGLRTSSNGNTYFEVGNGTTSVPSPSFTLTANTWFQVVGVWTNIASNSIELYVNGSSKGSNSHSFTSIKNTTSPLYIGSFNGGQFSQWLNGKVGVVRLYNSALTSSQILQNYNSDKTKYGL